MKLNVDIKKISIGILTFLLGWLGKKILDSTGVFEKISALIKDSNSQSKFILFLKHEISVWKFGVFLILLVISYFLINLVYTRLFSKNIRVTKKQDQIKKQNHRTIGDILFYYDVEFDEDNKLYIENLTPYCIKHGKVPVKMNYVYYREAIECSMPNCDTKIPQPKYATDGPIDRITNIITSELEQRWREMN